VIPGFFMQFSVLSSQFSEKLQAAGLIKAIRLFSILFTSDALSIRGHACCGLKYSRFCAITSCVSSSAREPRAWLRN